jgi:hypothetical protein
MITEAAVVAGAARAGDTAASPTPSPAPGSGATSDGWPWDTVQETICGRADVAEGAVALVRPRAPRCGRAARATQEWALTFAPPRPPSPWRSPAITRARPSSATPSRPRPLQRRSGAGDGGGGWVVSAGTLGWAAAERSRAGRKSSDAKSKRPCRVRGSNAGHASLDGDLVLPGALRGVTSTGRSGARSASRTPPAAMAGPGTRRKASARQRLAGRGAAPAQAG